MKLIKLLLLSFVLILLQGCLEEGDKVSLSVEKGQDPQSSDPTNDPDSTSDTDQTSNNGSSPSDLTFTPKGASVGDDINLTSHIALLVTATNSSNSEVSGDLTLAGTDASKLELIAVSGFSQNGDGVSYTIAASSSAKFLVVRKSDFSTSVSAKIQDNSSGLNVDVANISSSSLGYSILYWFNPKDITSSNVNDVDGSGDLSDGDILTSLPDRSGNDYFLTNSSTTNMATYISSGKNGHNNINMNAYSSGSSYINAHYKVTSGAYLPITAGDDFLYVMSASLNNSSVRQSFKTFDPAVCGSPSYCKGIIGIDVNTHQTTGQKHGAFIAGTSNDASVSASTSPEVMMLSMKNTLSSSSILSNTTYYVNNSPYTLSRRAISSGSNGNFSNYSEQAQIIRIMFNAKIYESIIVMDPDITEGERENLHCYLALKSDISPGACQ